MKKIALAIALISSGVLGLAQGTLVFNNTPSAIGGTGAPLFDLDGTTRLAGTAFAAQVYAGPTADSLQPWGPVLNFRTGAGAGFVVSYTDSVVVSTVAPDANAFVVVKAWETGAGITSYETAAAAGKKVGMSASPFTVKLGGAGSPPSLPANLVGMTSFALVPEPSAIALGLLGLAALALRRRK